MTRIFLASALLAAAGFSLTAGADDHGGPCSVQDRSEAVVIMICPAALSEDDLRTAGQKACGEELFCNVWIWNDAADAPDVAPETDGELDKAKTSLATAIWVNDSESLVLVRRSARN